MPQNDSSSTAQIRRAHLRIMLMAAGMVVLTALLAGMAAVLPFYQSSRASIENSLQMPCANCRTSPDLYASVQIA